MKKLLMILAVAAAAAASAIETSIAYQGVLRSATGGVLTEKSKKITFRLYTQATGGTAIWGRTIAATLDDTGLFNVELNDNGTPVSDTTYELLAEALASARGTTLYVGLFVDGSAGEITPRQKILMTPYSSWAADVSAASGNFSVSGVATMASASVGGGLTVGGTATMNGDASFENNVSIAGNLTVKETGSISGFGTVPVGGIIMWSGSKVPEGWALCNGDNGTPNLVDRFILGASTSTVNGTGGRSSVSLSVSNLPSHDHYYSSDDNITKIKSNSYYNASDHVVATPGGYDATSKESGNGKVFATSKTGSGTSFDIMPPYYRLAFIMRTK